jgi:DNA-binding transcriptional ArsR family regulator
MVQLSRDLDSLFAAVADPTRRGVLQRLGRGDASIGALADEFGMTLTGIKKHVTILEGAGLVRTEKVGRVRTCRVGPRKMEEASDWIAKYREMWESRMDRLEEFLERTKGAAQ